MAYNSSKDIQLDDWVNEETGLNLSIYRYGEGEPKLQIGPRTYTKKDGSKGSTKPGRLTIDDLNWMSDVLEEVVDKMNQYFLDEK